MKEEDNKRAEWIVEAGPNCLNTSDLLQTARLFSCGIVGYTLE